MVTDLLLYYAHKFQKLRQGNTDYGKAPHKPVLLLAVIDEIESGRIDSPKIFLTPDLIGAFKDNWNALVDTPNVSDFMLPFFHLSGDGFWKQEFLDGTRIDKIIKSFKIFGDHLAYAVIDQELFNLLLIPYNRNFLKSILLDTYFSKTKTKIIANDRKTGKYLLELEESILNEKAIEFIPSKGIAYDMEYYLRSHLFKRYIPKLYENRCCISGMKITSIHGYSMIDACHIQPIHVQGPDHVKNGIALCPNLHRAFDKGLITVTPDYKVKVSSAFTEDEKNDYSLKKLYGKKILLPFGEKYYPGKEYLEWHGEIVWKG